MVFVKKSLDSMLEEIEFSCFKRFDYIIPDEKLSWFICTKKYLDIQNLDYVKSLMEDLLGEDEKYSRKDRDAICAAIENALTRGNNKQIYLPISIKIFSGKSGGILRLRDCGPGFNFKRKINQMKSRICRYFKGYGHGLKSLDKSNYEVSYEGNGNIINMMFKK